MPKYPQSQPRWHPGRWSLYRRSLPGYAGCGWLSGNAIAAPIKSKLHKMCSDFLLALGWVSRVVTCCPPCPQHQYCHKVGLSHNVSSAATRHTLLHVSAHVQWHTMRHIRQNTQGDLVMVSLFVMMLGEDGGWCRTQIPHNFMMSFMILLWLLCCVHLILMAVRMRKHSLISLNI